MARKEYTQSKNYKVLRCTTVYYIIYQEGEVVRSASYAGLIYKLIVGSMLKLTQKQEWVFGLIRDYRMSHGESPTISELMKMTGLVGSTIQYYIAALVRKGWLYKVEGKARGLILVVKKDEEH